MEGFINLITDGALLLSLVMLIEKIKTIQKKETVKKLKAKHFYMWVFIVACIPLSIISGMKAGVFDNNTIFVIIGTTIRTWFIMAAFGTGFYEAIKLYLDKKKEEINE